MVELSSEIEKRQSAPTALLLVIAVVDAVVYLVCAFKFTDTSFLYIERIITRNGMILRDALYLLATLIPAVANTIMRRQSPRTIALKAIAHVLITVGIFAILPYYYVTGFPWKPIVNTGYSNNWIPMDWHRLYLNLFIMWYASRTVFVGLLIAFVGMTWLKLAGKLKRSASAIYLAAFVVLTWYVFRIENHPVHSSLIHYNFPLLPVVLTGLTGFTLWFSRTLLVSHILLIISIFYFGLSPIPGTTRPPDPKLFTKIFPTDKPDPRILLNFTRQGIVDREGKYLYQSFGPTSGITKFDLTIGHIVGNPIAIKGLIRFFWTDWDSPFILGANYISFDVHVISKNPFRLVRQFNLRNDRFPNSPMAIDAAPELGVFYIVYYEYGGIGEYSLKDYRALRKIYFKEEGISQYNTGGYQIAIDHAREKILVPIGVVDTENHYKLLRIDARTLKVEDSILYDEGGLGFVYVPSINRAFNTTFYDDNIYEFEVFPKLRLVKKIKGPYCSKSIAYDPKRDYLYTSSFASGEFYAISRATGKTVYRTFLGNKAENVYFHPLLDRVYLSSSGGIYYFDVRKLDAYLAHNGKGAVTPKPSPVTVSPPPAP